MTILWAITITTVASCILLSTAVRPEAADGKAAKRSGQTVLQSDMLQQHDEPDVVARGGSYVPSCEQLMESLGHQQEACTMDEFLEAALAATWELDCQFQKAHTALELLTNRFQQRAIAWQRQSEQFKSMNALATYSQLKPCPNTCGSSCLGQMYMETADGRGLVMLPQPKATGAAYAYDGTDVRVLTDGSEITSVVPDRINRGLWYASLVGHLENYSQTEKYYFSNGIQSQLRYRGNDPAILAELDTFDGKDGQSICAGAPNKNVIDPGNYKQFFSNGSTLKSDELRPYWTMGTQLRTVVASKVALDHEHKPMGTVSLNVDFAVLGRKFLDKLSYTPNTYAVIVERLGRIIVISPLAKMLIFGRDVKDENVYNSDGKRRCSKGSPHNCTWEPLKPISILQAAEVDFSAVLQEMFNKSAGTSCSQGMHNGKVVFPSHNDTCSSRCSDNGSTTHLLSFCVFSSVPEWGLIIGTSYADITGAASMEVTPKKVMVDYTVQESAEFEKLQDKRQIIITNTGRIPFPFLVDMSHGDFVEIEPQRGLLEHNQSAVISVMVHARSAKTFGKYSGVLHVRANLLESRGTCFRTDAHVSLLMNILKSKSFLQQLSADYGEWILGLLAAMVVLVFFLVASKMIRSHVRKEARQTLILEQAIQSTKALQHPMVLITIAEFKKHETLLSHEEVHGRSVWLYTIDEVEIFCSEHHVVFVSHQWTAFDCPDPTNIQYRAMLMSIETLRVQQCWQEQDMFLWVDYSSIPQKHSETQALAINSLTTYASHVDAFVVVAPEVDHRDLGVVCHKGTYQGRAWCRAEQLAHLLAVGSKNMYLAEDGVLTHLSDIEGWLEQSVDVFSGNLTCCQRKHEGMDKCDKELLVTPMLGLWAQLCQRCHEHQKQLSRQSTFSEKLLKVTHVHRSITDRIEEVFPREFDFQHHDGHVERRQLFGDLLSRLPQLQEDEDAILS